MNEEKAFRAFIEWVEQGKRVCKIFEQEGIKIPPTLQRFYGEPAEVSSRKIAIKRR